MSTSPDDGQHFGWGGEAVRTSRCRPRPGITLTRLGFLRWRWRVLHPRTGSPLLAGTAPTRRRAQAHADRAAQRWTEQYGHLLR